MQFPYDSLVAGFFFLFIMAFTATMAFFPSKLGLGLRLIMFCFAVITAVICTYCFATFLVQLDKMTVVKFPGT